MLAVGCGDVEECVFKNPKSREQEKISQTVSAVPHYMQLSDFTRGQKFKLRCQWLQLHIQTQRNRKSPEILSKGMKFHMLHWLTTEHLFKASFNSLFPRKFQIKIFTG